MNYFYLQVGTVRCHNFLSLLLSLLLCKLVLMHLSKASLARSGSPLTSPLMVASTTAPVVSLSYLKTSLLLLDINSDKQLWAFRLRAPRVAPAPVRLKPRCDDYI